MKGQTIAVTGGARGIGLETARLLVERGATVWIGDLDLELAEREAASIGARAAELDVSDRSSFAAFLEAAAADAPLDTLINNAGVMPFGAFLDEDESVIERTIEVNLLGVINGMRLALPAMRERKSGHVVNVASLAARLPVPGSAVYSGTKAAVLAMTDAIRREIRGSGVRLTTVLPGMVMTELVGGAKQGRGVSAIPARKVAEAIGGALDGGGGTVVVPGRLDPVSRLVALAPRRLEDALRTLLGDDRLLTQLDEEARREYEQRIADQARGSSTTTGIRRSVRR